MSRESASRGILEVATAVLLGLVSVATAVGAYQASVWAQQAGEYSSIAQQLRDRNLSAYIATDLAIADDGDILFELLQLEFDIADGGGDAADLRAQQRVLLETASAGLADEWDDWVAAGYPDALFPGSGDAFLAAQYAPAFSMNSVSVVASEQSSALGARSFQITIASVVFGVALLLLGISGSLSRFVPAAALAAGGAVAFLGGVALTVLAIA